MELRTCPAKADHLNYKVILDCTEPGTHGIGFILPNAPSKLPLSSFAVNIGIVEKITGLEFFQRFRMVRRYGERELF